MEVANTLAYLDTATITSVKSFIVQALGECNLKLLAVVWNFLRPYLTKGPSKLECLSPASFSTPGQESLPKSGAPERFFTRVGSWPWLQTSEGCLSNQETSLFSRKKICSENEMEKMISKSFIKKLDEIEQIHLINFIHSLVMFINVLGLNGNKARPFLEPRH